MPRRNALNNEYGVPSMELKDILNKLTAQLALCNVHYQIILVPRSDKTVHCCLLTTLDMEILRVNRRVLTALGMCSLADGSLFHLKVRQMAVAILLFVIFILGAWCSALFCLEHYRMGDMGQNLFALVQFVGVVPTITNFISLVYGMRSVRHCFNRIQKIFDQCN